MVITTSAKRGWLNWCSETDTGANLLSALKAQRNARATELKTGQVIAGSAANNHSVSFSNVENAGTSPADMFAMWQELVDLFTASKADLITAGDPTPTDAEVLAEMLYRLSEVRSYETTYTGVLP